MPYQILGIDPTQVVEATGTGEFPLGQIGEDSDGNRFIYGRAGAAIGAKEACKFNAAWDFTESGNAGIIDAVSQVALADNEYGWFQTAGVCAAANLATGVNGLEPLSAIADANGDFVSVVGVGEGGAVTHVAGAQAIRAKALEDEDAGVGDIFLYTWI